MQRHDLTCLHIVGNLITEIPESLGILMHSLTELNINSNKLISLPRSIGDLKSLKILRVDENKITEFQPALCRYDYNIYIIS